MKAVIVSFFLLITPIIATPQGSGKDAVVAASKMNVLYRGLPNPVEIAVPGFASEKISATVTNGTIRKVADGWEVSPGEDNLTIITVLANNKKVSDKTFRVKNIPQPAAAIGGMTNGSLPKSKLLENDVLDVRLVDFDWDLKFTVKSFTLMVSMKGEDHEIVSEGNKLTDKMKALLNTLQKGQSVVFKDIKVVGPDGKISDLQPLILKVE